MLGPARCRVKQRYPDGCNPVIVVSALSQATDLVLKVLNGRFFLGLSMPVAHRQCVLPRLIPSLLPGERKIQQTLFVLSGFDEGCRLGYLCLEAFSVHQPY